MQKRLLLLFFWMGSLVLFTFPNAAAQQWNLSHKIGTLSGNYHFNYNQIPEQLIELLPAAVPNTGLTYQWEQSAYPTTGFITIEVLILAHLLLHHHLHKQLTTEEKQPTPATDSLYIPMLLK
jgi:hypothetical protein